jgi:DNA polymerase (family 10)
MINLKLSSLLTAISELSRLKSNGSKTVINLTHAARTIRDFEGDIYEAFLKGEVENLPGIDDFSFNLIKEYFETGKINLFEEIKEKYSEELIRIIRVSGLGAKRVFNIYEKLKINTYEDLRNFFSSNYDFHNFEVNFGIKPIYLERLKYSLNYFESFKNKYPRWLILRYAQKIVNGLLEYKEILYLKVVGSVRRRKSYVEDIDILILPNFNKAGINIEKSLELLKKIKNESFIKEEISKDIRNENVSSKFKTIFGPNIEIIITSEDRYVYDLIYTTGSKKHLDKLDKYIKKANLFNKAPHENKANKRTNSLLEELALNKNSEIKNKSRYEVEVFENDNSICLPEKEFYEYLGLDYIYPELREGINEVELSSKNNLPNLIKISDLKGDLHIHSNLSDGILNMEEVMKKIKKFGYDYISFSDHSESNTYGNGLSIRRLKEKKEFIDNLNSKNRKITFLYGSEIEINEDGSLDYPQEVISSFDFAIGSIHKGFSLSFETNDKRIERAMQNEDIDVIAHPTGIVFGNRAPYFVNMENLIELANKYRKALEINSYYLRLDLDEENSRKAKESGVLFSIDTDSHRENNLDMIRLGVDIARRAGIEKEQVINTHSLDKLKKWKKTREI